MVDVKKNFNGQWMAGGLQEMIPKPIYEIDHMIVVGTKDQLEKENSFLKVESSENCVERTKIAQFDVLIFCIRSDKNFVGKLLIDLDLRGKYVVNVVSIRRDYIDIVDIQPNMELRENDILLLVGAHRSIELLSKLKERNHIWFDSHWNRIVDRCQCHWCEIILWAQLAKSAYIVDYGAILGHTDIDFGV